MKVYRQRDFNKSGIYQIKNLIDNKIYIGKAKCIYSRIINHITLLRSKSKNENRYLINAWHKYGENNFEYSVLEYVNLEENLLKEKELYWQRTLKVKERNIGYNFREDSETGMICSEETKKLMSEIHKKRFENKEERLKCSHDFWKKNPESLKKMSEKVAKLNVKYNIEQYDKKTKIFIKSWESIIELIKYHPEYKKHNIYAVCSGEKPSMYGYIWKKVLKLNDDIVHQL